MPIQTHITTETTWWIAHNNDNVFHHGKCHEGTNISTGQPFLELFNNKFDWDKRVMELLPADKINEFTNQELEIKEMIEQELEAQIPQDNHHNLDDMLYTDSVSHLLYGEKKFRAVANPNKREE